MGTAHKMLMMMTSVKARILIWLRMRKLNIMTNEPAYESNIIDENVTYDRRNKIADMKRHQLKRAHWEAISHEHTQRLSQYQQVETQSFASN